MIKHLKPRTEEEIQDFISTSSLLELLKTPDIKYSDIDKELSKRLKCNIKIHNMDVIKDIDLHLKISFNDKAPHTSH